MNNENKESQIKENALKISEITGGNVCNRCLGRNFYKDIEASDNQERGEYIKKLILNENNQKVEKNNDQCFICNDLLQFTEKDLTDFIINKIDCSGIEFSTFLIGCRVPPEIIEKEENLHSSLNLEGESIKKEINREIGKALSLKLEKEVDFESPNLVIMVDFTKNVKNPSLEFQINPLFIEGRYRKLIRGIPQTKWPCRKCKGKGCEYCNNTGKMYHESVEELISPEILKKTRGSESKFHGAGREDIDVKMLGRGRPFVVEIKNPYQRTLDLNDLEKKINQYTSSKVEVSPLKIVGKERRSQIKTSSTSTYKTYRALVDVDKEISNDELKLLDSMKIIKQRTPQRVSHRRADKIRTREITSILAKKIDSKTLELIIDCEGGLYIKELISGDENRTLPNISSLLSTSARCVQLDVLDVKNNS